MNWVLVVVFLLAEGVTETVQVPMQSEALCRAAEVEVKRVDALQRGLDLTVDSAIQNPQYPVMTICLQTRVSSYGSRDAADLDSLFSPLEGN